MIQKCITYCFSLCLLMSLASCGSDGETRLNYDGDNFSAPLLEAGTYIGSARFSSNDFADLESNTLTAIEFYLLNVPNSTEIKIFGQGSNTEPGTEIYNSDVTLDANVGWNTHNLTSPITLGDDDIWLSVQFTHGGDDQTLGCDEGPANIDGDHFQTTTGAWTNLRAFSSNEVDINWNIRGVVE